MTYGDLTKHHYRLVDVGRAGSWLWEYDGDDPMPARMYWVFKEDRHFYVPTEHGPPKPSWCRMPWCDDFAVDEFCANHTPAGLLDELGET